LTKDQTYLLRCLELASLGAGYVAPNPMVGAVLVYNDMIIGEGYHQQYGQAHAEVNCINSVKVVDKHLIPDATLYVSLEPCAHFGKTPPCANLIIDNKIKRVVIGCSDPFESVNGKGIDLLQQAGIDVTVKVLEQQSILLNKRFFSFHILKRPYIILKWAESNNGKISADNEQRTFISNDLSNRLVHKWRSEESTILVGTRTALLDNPSLTNRLWTGKNPARMCIDKKLVIPQTHHLLDNKVPTYIFNQLKNAKAGNTTFIKMEDENALPAILQTAFQQQLQSILVEGGTTLLQHFIDANIWDEIRIIRNTQLHIEHGTDAPKIKHANLTNTITLQNDSIDFYLPANTK